MRIPASTYRIQFNPSFGFNNARKTLRYLADLGVSHIYASPIFRAKSGSEHGYDLVDPNQINPELGSWDDFERLLDEARNNGLSWIQDFVPNHMAFDYQNEFLRDVLENGRVLQFLRH
jgi:(1->4)-alpha-D-glucan 1-alpha-D-glucosylmutase